MSRYISPVETITDLNGAPMVGAKLVFYETGTATLKTVYSDSGLSVPIANPVTAVSSGAGAIYPDIYLDGIYKVVQQDDTGTAGVADGVVLWTRDPVGAIATGNFEVWLNDSTYSIPEVVYASDDNYYISLVDANQGNEPSVSPAQWQLIPVKDMVGLTETQTLTNKTLTSPALVTPTFADSGGDELIIVTGVATPVNEPTITNAASGNKPSINQTGTDDVGLDIEGIELHNGAITSVTSNINGAAATDRSLFFNTAGLNRWRVVTGAIAETGSNAGSNLYIQRYNDAGATIDSPITINRATGLCTITNLDASAFTSTRSFSGTIGAGGNAAVNNSDDYAFAPKYTSTGLLDMQVLTNGILLSNNTGVSINYTATWKYIG